VQNSKEHSPNGVRGTRIPMIMMTMIMMTMIIRIMKLHYLDT